MKIVTLALATLLGSTGTSMANLALPALAKELLISFGWAKWIVLSYLMALTIFSPLVGWLSDRFGRRQVFLLGAALFTSGAVTSALSHSFISLILGRLVQGIGAAPLVVLPLAMVTDFTLKQKFGQAIGLLATMSAMGTAAGPSLGGLVMAAFGWRGVFGLLSFLSFLVLLLSLKFVPNHKPSDKSGAGFSNLGMDSLKHLFSNLVVSAVMASTLIVGPFYLAYALQLNPAAMGLVMSAGPLTSVFCGSLAGYAVDRLGTGFVLKAGLSQLLIGTMAFVILPWHLGPFGFVLSAVLLSFGYQLFIAANSTRLMSGIGTNQRGSASGALNLSRNFGLVLGTYLLGGLFNLFIDQPNGRQLNPDHISTGLQLTFLTASILIVLLLIIQFKPQRKET